MKKNLIWLLTGVMAVTFSILLYFQIMYLENMVQMREEQFSEGVMRSLNATAEFLERRETQYFLEQDVNIIESSVYDDYNSPTGDSSLKYSVENADGSVTNYTLSSEVDNSRKDTSLPFPAPTQNVGDRYGSLQEVIRSQYLYQKGLLSEVILSVLRDSGSRPLLERADSTAVRNCLQTELANNGVTLPFAFAVYNSRNTQIYSVGEYNDKSKDTYTIPLFANTNASYILSVEFPTKNTFIFSSVRFIIPTLALTLMLIVIFVYTLVMVLKQKKISEIKTDFVNNMTHELKTPISTISLAGQMLSDPSVTKSPSTIAHLSEVITDESKRLRFQVEKVLHMSVFENEGATLNFTSVNANSIISGVVNTFKLKVERQGGSLSMDLNASHSDVVVDEMQFTNVLFNLLDNALKYMRDDTEPRLSIATRDLSGKRLEIQIADNGIGIKKDDLKRIFEKFYRVPTGNLHNVKGFGLGLAYVKKMITAFHGQITVESEPGVGSTFIIVLPLEA